MSEKNRFLCLALAVVGLLLLGVGIQTPRANAAQEKDSLAGRTLRIIVPYAPGGAFDRLATVHLASLKSEVNGGSAGVARNKPYLCTEIFQEHGPYKVRGSGLGSPKEKLLFVRSQNVGKVLDAGFFPCHTGDIDALEASDIFCTMTLGLPGIWSPIRKPTNLIQNLQTARRSSAA
jgi:hypothetical protein